VSESAAIARYLGDRHALGSLAPMLDDPARAAYLRWSLFSPSVIEPAAAAKASGGAFNAGAVGWGTYEAMLDATEAASGAGPWLLGERFTMADTIFGGTLRFLLTFKMVDPRPALTAYSERLAARPALQRATARNTAVAAEHGLNRENDQSFRPMARAMTQQSFTKTLGWLDWYANPSKPQFILPPGAVDAHCHVFGPGAEFPFAPERKYTPCDASKAQLFALRDQLGFARNVIVQATCHGADNRAMMDACIASQGRARGVATVRRTVSDAELQALHQAGVRGVRFNFVKRLVDFTPRDELMEIGARVGRLGWHVVIYFEAVDLPELWDFFTALPTDVVVDHMGRPDVRKPIDGPEFSLFLKFMREHSNVWSKVSCPE